MKSKTTLHRMFVLLITLMSAIGANAQEAYACFTGFNLTLTFYYDNLRSTRTQTTYDLNTGSNEPDWYTDGNKSNVTKVVFDPSFADARPTTTNKWFSSMGNLVSITGINYLNTSEVTNMSWMFVGCSKLTSLDVSHFNTSKVISMYRMFESCSRLTSLDLSNFNTSQVKNMCGMFSECSSLTSLDLSQFNTSEVTEMWSMFMRCNSLTTLDLSTFNTSKVKDMTEMFLECNNLQTIYVGDGWNTGAISSAYDTFLACYNLKGGKGTAYDAKYVHGYFARIDGGPSEPGYLTDVSTRQAYAVYTEENTTLTFYYDNLRDSRTGTTYDLNTGARPEWLINGTNANVTKVVFDSSFVGARPTITSNWFNGMGNLIIIEGMNYLNTSEVTNMFGMFVNCEQLTKLDLSCFNTSKVSNMNLLFSGCKKLRTIYVGDGWSTGAVTQSTNMFSNCTSLKGGKGTTYNDSNPKDKSYAHIDGEGGPGYFTARTTGIATDLHQVTSDKQQVQSDEWYTIDGRKLNGMPTKKGVYIQNGKKTVVK